MQESHQIKSNINNEKHKLTDQVQNLQKFVSQMDFNTLFAEMNRLQDENSKLQDKNFQLMFRVFLLTVNTERLGKCGDNSQKTIEALTHKFHEEEIRYKNELEK
jgi:chromosome segregation ATPase